MNGERILALPDESIDRVVFYKRDELTTDLICCEVHCGDTVHFAHEETAIWPQLVAKVEKLPGFRTDWFASVSQPVFETCEIVAFQR